MWRTGWKFSVLALLLVLAMVWTPAFAAEVVTPTPGSGPEIPLGLAEEWTKLEAGGTRWHAFYFMHPHAMIKGESADLGTVTVRMEFSPKEVGEFEILSQKEVDLWAKEEKYTPLGIGTLACGCNLEDNPRKMSWTGVPLGHSMNYILVKNPTNKDLYYRLFIDENPYVGFPPPITSALAAAPAPAQAPAAAVPAAAPAPVVATGPQVGEWFYLPSGQDAWFELAYDATDGVNHDKTPEMMEVKLMVEDKHPLDNVLFEVFTDAEYKQFLANGEDISGEDLAKGTAIGVGTCSGSANGQEFSWKGNFTNSQTIHVLVHSGARYADGLNLKLDVTGKTVQAM